MISGLKKISGAMNLSNPTSTEYGCVTNRYLLSYRINEIHSPDPFVTFRFILAEFLDNIRTYIRVHFFYALGNFKRLFGRNRVFALAQDLLHKMRYITPGNGDVLD